LAKVGRVGSVIKADDAEGCIGPEVVEIGNETEGMGFLVEGVGLWVEGCTEKREGR
jgi:hypothetical protein